MAKYLSSNWDLGMAISEFISAALLFFFVLTIRWMVFNKHAKHQNLICGISMGVACFVAVVFGWGVGSLISGPGAGLSLMTPIAVIAQSFSYDTYNAMWFLILFEILGTSFGFLMFWLYKKTFNENWSFPIGNPLPIKQNSLKSAIFQPLLILGIILIPSLNSLAYNGSMMVNRIILISFFILMFLLTAHHGAMIFSPLISAGIIALYWSEKRLNKAMTLNFVTEFSIQLLALASIVAVVITIKISQGIY